MTLRRALALVAVACLLLLNAAGASGQVSPSNQSSPSISAILGTNAAGDRVGYAYNGPGPGSLAGSLTSPRFAVRGEHGWVSTAVDYPYSNGSLSFSAVSRPYGASQDLSTWIWNSSAPLLPGAPAGNGLYRGGTDRSLALLGSGGSAPVVLGVSDDAQHVVFRTTSQLLPGDAGRTSGSQVYEYAGSTLRLVGVDSAGSLLTPCGAIAGSATRAPNALSRDGERIFMTSPAAACGGLLARVYLRQGGTQTTEISASQCTRADCGPARAVSFMGATPSGSVAFLATTQQLTNDDVDTSMDLYRYDVTSGTLSRVSAAAGVLADVVATRAYSSPSGARVYFVARGLLVPGKGTANGFNLYVSDAGGLRFIATLMANEAWTAPGAPLDGVLHEVQLTSDGDKVVFTTASPVAANDTDTSADAYLYEADDDRLDWVSGTGFGGNGSFPVGISRSEEFPTVASFLTHPPHSLSDDGRHVFFTTSEALVADDVDGGPDVYEWAGGHVALISSGAGPDGGLRYGGATPDGSTVFFATDDSLTWDDDDGGDQDLYAARVGGGFPEPESPPPACVGNACQPPSNPRPIRPTPESLGGSAPGADLAPAPQKRMKVRGVGASALRHAAASGILTLVVHAPAPGTVSARAWARIGERPRTVASARTRARQPGTVRLRLRLSSAARRSLKRGHVVRLRIAVRHWKLPGTDVLKLELEKEA